MSKVLIKIIDINSFIKYAHENSIEILSIKYYKNYTHVLIYENDLKKLEDISVVKYYGWKRVNLFLKKNKYFLIALILGLIVFMILSNIIYDIDIKYNNSKLKESLLYELKIYGIKKYSFVKSYDDLEKIKNAILNKRKDIEWLMIERVGTKYIVKLEERKVNEELSDNKIYNIVAKKDARIKKIISSKGDVLKNVGDYVHKGDVIITSDIYLYDNFKGVVKADGLVYGEVWYKVKVEYPLRYYEEIKTGKIKNKFNIKVFDRYLLPSSYENRYVEDNYILKHDLFPIAFVKQKEIEYKALDYDLTYEEALIKALEKAKESIMSKLGKEEHIIYEKKLKSEMKDSKIEVVMFYAVYESIGTEG